jgi:hypothetical protein
MHILQKTDMTECLISPIGEIAVVRKKGNGKRKEVFKLPCS